MNHKMVQDIMDTALLHAKAAMNYMHDQNIPPTPENFSIWYQHCANKSQAKQAAPSKEQQAQTLKGLQSHANNTTSKTVSDTHDVLADALEVITGIITEADSHNHTIQHNLDTIIDKHDETHVTTIVEALVQAAKDMKQSGVNMRTSLEESRLEVESLKENLAELSVEVERDFLTGIYNRKAMDTHLTELIYEAETHNTELCVLMLDIDHFKSFNDNFGHLIGDEVLKMVAKILTNSLKGKDVVARFGGEEFIVLLPDTPIGAAMTVAEHIRKTIANKELMHRASGNSFGSVTVSIGLAQFHHKEEGMEELVKRADDALYRSKRGGRNRVTQETFSCNNSADTSALTFN